MITCRPPVGSPAPRGSSSQQWQQVLAWRDLIRMRTDLPLPLAPTGDASAKLAKPAEVIEKLELW
ncbi:hypothetical protein GCM10027597_09680 [Saccharopolyspora tripterygii]